MKKPKRIKPVILDDSLILNSDSDGTDFLRLGLKVRERGQWGPDAIKLVHVNFPSTGSWNAYAAEVGALLTVLAMDFDDPALPDDVVEMMQNGNFQAWAALNASRFKVKAVRDQTERIFFDYLDPEVEGMSLEESKTWIRRHFPYQRVHEMFVAICDVESWVKKNAQSALETMFRTSVRSSFTRGLPKKPATPSAKSKGSQRFAPSFNLLDSPKPTPIN